MNNVRPEEKSVPYRPVLALQAVLLFHSASPWDEEKRKNWQEIAHAVLGEPWCSDEHYSRQPGGRPVEWEATTRVLCDIVRAALGSAMKD